MNSSPITVAQAIQHLECIPRYRRQDVTLQVEVFRPGSIGGTPRVAVVQMHAGFDWDQGAFLLKPEQPLTALNQSQIKAIVDSASKGLSWHAYQAQKALREKAQAMEGERDKFRAACAEWDEKTAWVQQTARPHELGRHRADILRERIEALEAELSALKQGGV